MLSLAIIVTYCLTSSLVKSSDNSVIELMTPNTPGIVSNEYCEAETFKPTCPQSHVILIRKALYGRMRLGRCVIRDYGYVGCHADVLVHMDAQCSGIATCQVRIPDATLDRVNPCPKDFKTYLEVSYECVPVHTVRCKSHCNSTEVTSLSTESAAIVGPVLTMPTTTSGFIMTDLNPRQALASNIACMNRGCMVVLRAKPGQRLNITLLDFTLEQEERNQLKHQLYGVETCYRYAVMRESSRARDVDVCGGLRRSRHVYTSQTNELQLQFVSSLVHDRVPKFLVHYQVIGCADITTPENSWIRRDESTLTVYCSNNEQQVYQVTCVNNQWTGHIGRCQPEPQQTLSSKTVQNVEPSIHRRDFGDDDEDAVTSDYSPRPTGLFIAIVGALAVIMATFVLAVGILTIRRCSPDASSRSTSQKSRNIPCPYDVNDDVDDQAATTNHDYCCNKSMTYVAASTLLKSNTNNAQMTTSLEQDEVDMTSYIRHYECTLQRQQLQQQQQQQLELSASTALPATSSTTHVITNNYAKYDDVRYSAVGLMSADEFCSNLQQQDGVSAAQGHHPDYNCPLPSQNAPSSTDATYSYNVSAPSVKYSPHLSTVAELEMETLSTSSPVAQHSSKFYGSHRHIVAQ